MVLVNKVQEMVNRKEDPVVIRSLIDEAIQD